MPALEPVWIALGSNLGVRARYLAAGRSGIAAIPGVRVTAATGIVETAPIGPAGQGYYLNQMLLAHTAIAPDVLLVALQGLERGAGRRRDVRWGPRTLDLDIVRFGDRRIVTDSLVVPHPELAHRAFWTAQMEDLEPYVR